MLKDHLQGEPSNNDDNMNIEKKNINKKFNQKSGAFRWLILSITCLTMFAIYYCYDNPVALQDELENDYNLSMLQYNLLYSVYAFPNAFLPFFGGIITDILGVNVTMIFFFSLIGIGHSLFILGCIWSYYPLMILGRFLFGTGSESYQLVEMPFIYEYFAEKELAFALGLNVSLARIGSSVNDYFTYFTYKKTNSIIFALSVGFVFCFISFVMIILVVIYRIYERKRIKKTKTKPKLPKMTDIPKESSSLSSQMYLPQGLMMAADQSAGDLQQSVDRSYIYLKNNENNITTNNNDIINKEKEHHDEVEEEEEEEENEKFRLSDIKTFDSCYWLLTLNCGLIYCCVMPWMNIGADYIKERYKYNQNKANDLLMIPYIICGVFAPIFGYICDKYGRRGYLLLLSTVLCVVSHYIFGWMRYGEGTPIYIPIAGLVGIGIAFAVFCAVIWPSFAYLVNPRCMGTAYGIPSSFYNATLSGFYVLIGVLAKNQDSVHKYENVESFLISVSGFTVFTALLLFYFDMKSGKRLHSVQGNN